MKDSLHRNKLEKIISFQDFNCFSLQGLFRDVYLFISPDADVQGGDYHLR